MADTAGSRPVVGMYAFRSPNPRRLAAFWAELMELPLSEHSTDELIMLDFDHHVGPVTWLFELDPSVGGAPSRVSLDIGRQTEDGWPEVADRAEKAGALRKAEHESGGARWIDMEDPDGNPFRVHAPRPVQTPRRAPSGDEAASPNH